ncbi:MAG: hypothetical protein PHV36_07035 [Elusimicrobiales bacterium]|nr:hypothetical protein [Elusimicrobiales bacterium]
MSVHRLNKFLCAFFSAALFCACAHTARKIPAPGAPPEAPVKKEAAVKKEAVLKLSPEDAKEVESLYYKAVGAYGNNDMDAALGYINEISTLYPSYPPAVELRDKIKSVSAADKLPPPQKP